MPRINHTHDSDCTVDPETDCCIECGVFHGPECGGCDQRGFHSESCEDAAHEREEHISKMHDDSIRRYGDR